MPPRKRTTFLGTYELTAFPRALTLFSHSTGSNFTVHLVTFPWTPKAASVGGLFHLPRRQLFAFNIARFGDIFGGQFS